VRSVTKKSSNSHEREELDEGKAHGKERGSTATTETDTRTSDSTYLRLEAKKRVKRRSPATVKRLLCCKIKSQAELLVSQATKLSNTEHLIWKVVPKTRSAFKAVLSLSHTHNARPL
jgi:hypothetical protein